MSNLLKITVTRLAIAIFFIISLANATPYRLPSDGLIIGPNDEIAGDARDSFVSMLDSAKSKIDLSIYQLRDPAMINAIMRAHNRGVKIRIVTEKHPFKHEYSNKGNSSELERLTQAGIPIKGLTSRLAVNNKAQAHHKILIIDSDYAVIMNFNWDTSSLIENRNFALVIGKNNNAKEFQEIESLFDADWKDEKFSPQSGYLVIGPDHQREKFIKLFSQAKKCIRIYQQSYNDEEIVSVLEKLSRQGIKIKLLMMPFPFGGKKDINAPFQKRLIKAGGEVKLNKTRYMHAKAVIIDDEIAYIGSCNFYQPSLDFNREVGALTTNKNAIKRLIDMFEKDYKS